MEQIKINTKLSIRNVSQRLTFNLQTLNALNVLYPAISLVKPHRQIFLSIQREFGRFN